MKYILKATGILGLLIILGSAWSADINIWNGIVQITIGMLITYGSMFAYETLNDTELHEYMKIGTVDECRQAVRFKRYLDCLCANDGLTIINLTPDGSIESFGVEWAFYEKQIKSDI